MTPEEMQKSFDAAPEDCTHYSLANSSYYKIIDNKLFFWSKPRTVAQWRLSSYSGDSDLSALKLTSYTHPRPCPPPTPLSRMDCELLLACVDIVSAGEEEKRNRLIYENLAKCLERMDRITALNNLKDRLQTFMNSL